MNRLGLVTYVAREYDEAIGFFVGKLGFTLVEDTDLGDGKRWVVVSAGEGYDDAALRELDEEVGVTGVPLVEMGVGTYSDEEVSLVGRCFMVKYDGPLVLRDGEVVAIEWVSQNDLLKRLAERDFLPDSKTLVLPALQKILK